MILRDRKGFSKSIEVQAYPPVYHIAEMPPILAITKSVLDYRQPDIKKTSFYPDGVPKENDGVYTLVYTEFN